LKLEELMKEVREEVFTEEEDPREMPCPP
jgi:hypothetical protein